MDDAQLVAQARRGSRQVARPLGRPRTFAYDVVRVRKTRGIETAVPGRDPGRFPLGLDFQPFILRDQAGRVLAPRPLGNSKVSLCRRAPALG